MIELFAIAVLQVSVAPQHTSAYARLDNVSGYVAPLAACGRLGYRISDDSIEELQRRAYAESKGAGVPFNLVVEWSNESVTRHSAQFQRDRDRPLEEYKAGGDAVLLIKGMLDRQAAKCQEMALDPILQGLLTVGDSQEMAEARQAVEDQFLEATGKASWQTPYIQERGSLLYILGVCKALLPETYHDRLLAEHLPTPQDQDRLSQWLAAEYQGGLANASRVGLDTSQCAGVMRTAEADLAKARSSQ